MKTYAAMITILLLAACAQLPEATGEMAQAVSSAGQVVQAETVDEVLTQNINIPLHYMLLLGAACTFVPNPFQMVGRAFNMMFGGVFKLWKTFKGE